MKDIKLTGREMAVLKAIDYTSGSTGAEIFERTHIEELDILDILNALADVGYVEAYAPDNGLPLESHVTREMFSVARFEVNPSYALQLKDAMKR